MVIKPDTLKTQIIINEETYLIDIDMKLTKVIANPVPVKDSDGDGIPDDKDPTPHGEPQKPPTEPETSTEAPKTGVIKEGGWGADLKDKAAWKVTPMTGDKWKGLWKIVDKNGINVVTEFKDEAQAKTWLAYFQKNEFPPKPDNSTDPVPNPIPVGSKVDAQGFAMLYAPKQGGQVITDDKTYQKESKHNTGPRTSLYATVEYTANSGEITQEFTMDLSEDDEQNAPKLLSGGHGSEPTEQGQCYAVGINQNGTLHLAKEVPKHPDTPKFYDKIKYVDPNWKGLGNIKGKKVYMKIVYFPVEKDGKKGMHLEWWFDVKALDTGKLENDWRQCAYADDFGDWKGPPHLENMGVKYKGKILGFYIRIDQVKKPVEFGKVGMHELQLPAVRVTA